jgi:PKHD-type hydroxylase
MARVRGTPNDKVNVAFNSSNDHSRLFSADECEAIIALAEADVSGWAREYRTKSADTHDVFKTYSTFVIDKGTNDGNIAWAPRRFQDKIVSLNRQIWNFDIDDISDVFVLRYGVNDRFEQHIDLGPGYWDRKLSMLVQLSAADSYEGGAVEFGFAPTALASRQQGSLLVFPAWVPHRVTPITSGTRYVAGCFVLGPSFR